MIDAADDDTTEVADRAVPKFRKAVFAGLATIRKQVALDDITDSLEGSTRLEDVIDFTQLLHMDSEDRFTKADEPSPFDVLVLETMETVGEKTLGLDISDPFVVDAAERQTARMVTGIRNTTRKAITTAITEAVAGDLTRSQTAAAIKSTIGLTPSDVTTLANYRRGLTDLMNGTGTVAQIRNRWTGAPRGSLRGLTKALIEDRVSGYADRMLKERARTIARTETMRAANAGRIESWRQAIRDGVLPQGVRKVWTVTLDELLCPVCAPMDGVVVAMSDPFEATERGLEPGERVPMKTLVADHPPLHPRCRCVLTLQTT